MKSIVVALVLATALSATPGTRAEQPAPARFAAMQPTQPTQPTQPIPFRKDEGIGAMALDVGLGLAIAIGAGIALLYLLRRHLLGVQNAPGRRLRVVETVRLGPKSALFLIELDGSTLLVGQQGEKLAVLAEPSASPATSKRIDNAA